MSPKKKTETTDNEVEGSEDPRTFEHPNAEDVRQGNVSAAQLPGGGGNVDPDEPDAQYPPGRVETTAPNPEAVDDPSSFVPNRDKPKTFETTAANPDFAALTALRSDYTH